MKLICVAGQCQNGKDTLADYLYEKLKDKHDFVRNSFAKGVKDIFCNAFGVDLAFIDKWKVIDEPPPGLDMPVRKCLQFIGDGFRQMQGNIWVQQLLNQDKDAIVADGRYINELTCVKENNGINILVWRPGYENDDPNPSEAQIRTVLDWFIQNGQEGKVNVPFDDNYPVGVDKVDFFMINNGDDSFFRKADELLIPYIEDIFCALH